MTTSDSTASATVSAAKDAASRPAAKSRRAVLGAGLAAALGRARRSVWPRAGAASSAAIASGLTGGTAEATGLAAISPTDAVGALRAALDLGATAATSRLGTVDGFLGDPKVRIPLPPSLQRLESGLRMLGLREEAERLVVSMNRAAESAVPLAKPLLRDAVRAMTVADAKKILSGGDTSVTDFFQGKTRSPLTERFLPIVRRETDKVGLAQQYNALAGQGAALGLVRGADANIERYVAGKAIDGLYLMIGEEERRIRADPVRTGNNLLSKVFGALR